MGFLDRLKSIVGGADGGSAAGPSGPLSLAPGDAVGWYRERWAVAGVRRLASPGQVTWHYCLRARDGSATVLAAEEGETPALWIQRPVDADLPWDTEVLDGIADEPFKLSSHGQASVTQFGDTPVPQARSVSYREFEDAAAERTVVLEDWMGTREVRVGEAVHEAELTLVRAADSGDATHDFWEAQGAAPSESQNGNPLSAAAKALTGSSDEEFLATDDDGIDQDPTAFDDEEWDEHEDRADTSVSAPYVEAILDSEEDEWVAAHEHIRQHGIPAEPRR